MYTNRLIDEDTANERGSFTAIRNNNPRDSLLVQKVQRENKSQVNSLAKEAEKIQAEQAAQLHKNIMEGRSTCKFCNNFNVLYYRAPDSNLLPNAPVAVPWDLKALLIEAGFQDPGLQAHLLAEHKDIIDNLKTNFDKISSFRDKLRTMLRLIEQLNYAKGNESAYIGLAVAYGEDPKTLLNSISAELKQSEEQYPLLSQVREQFWQEQRDKRNELKNWRKKMGLNY